MLTIYTDKALIPEPCDNIIEDIDIQFNNLYHTFTFDAKDRHFMQAINSATLHTESDTLHAMTPFGTCTLDNLSTGCKACILANHLKGAVISLASCGGNAIVELIATLSNSDCVFYLEHHYFFYGDARIKHKRLMINGKQVGTPRTLAKVKNGGV